MSILSRNRLKAYGFLLLNAAFWGFAAPIIKFSLDYTTPNLFLLYRFLIATILFLPFYLVYRKKIKTKTKPLLLLSLALLGTPLTLLPLFYGLNLTTSIEGSILEASSPLFIILGGLLFLRERMSLKEWLGFGITLIGTSLLTFEPVITGHSFTSISLTGNFLIIISNIIWASFLLIAKKYKTDTIELTFYSFLISIPFFFFLALTEGSLIPNRLAIPGIVYMATFGSIVAFWAYTEGQKYIEASEAAIFTYLRPVFALPLALLWLKEPMSPIAIASLIIITFGVFRCQKR